MLILINNHNISRLIKLRLKVNNLLFMSLQSTPIIPAQQAINVEVDVQVEHHPEAAEQPIIADVQVDVLSFLNL
jgi:hypothetical protein